MRVREMLASVLFAALALILCAPHASAAHGHGGHHPPYGGGSSGGSGGGSSSGYYEDPVITSVKTAKAVLESNWQRQKANKINTKKNVNALEDASDKKQGGQDRILSIEGAQVVDIDNFIEGRKERIKGNKKAAKELKKAEQKAVEKYLKAEDAYYKKYGKYYSAELAGALKERIEAEERALAAAEQEGQVEVKDDFYRKGGLNIPGVGEGKAVDNIYDERGPKSSAGEAAPAAPEGGGFQVASAAQGYGSMGGMIAGPSGASFSAGAAPLLGSGAMGSKGEPLGAASASAGRPKTESAAELLRRGESRFQAGDFTGALKFAEQAVELDPANAGGRILRSRALSRLARFDEAEAAARKAVELAPDDPRAQLALAWALLNMGKYKEALAAASRAIELDPDNAEAYMMRAFAYEQMGKRGLMLADLRKAARLDPERFGGHLKAALAGKDLFEPGKDSWKLLEPLAPPAGGGLKGVLIGLGALAWLALLWLGWRLVRWKQETARAVPSAPGKLPEGGELLAGKYELRRIVSPDGSARTWEAVDTTLERTAIVKKVPAAKVDRALADSRAIAAMKHPNIVDIYEIVEHPAGLYLVFEALSGRSVEQLIGGRSRLPFEQVRSILKPVADVLEALHAQGLTHGNLSPDCIQITVNKQVKVHGFGAWADSFKTGFRAPESAQGTNVPASDVYSLAACAAKMLTGRLPGDGRGVPEGLEEVFAGALDPDHSLRFQSASQFMEGLAAP